MVGWMVGLVGDGDAWTTLPDLSQPKYELNVTCVPSGCYAGMVDKPVGGPSRTACHLQWRGDKGV